MVGGNTGVEDGGTAASLSEGGIKPVDREEFTTVVIDRADGGETGLDQGGGDGVQGGGGSLHANEAGGEFRGRDGWSHNHMICR